VWRSKAGVPGNLVFEIHKSFCLYNLNAVCCCVLGTSPEVHVPANIQSCGTHVAPRCLRNISFHLPDVGLPFVGRKRYGDDQGHGESRPKGYQFDDRLSRRRCPWSRLALWSRRQQTDRPRYFHSFQTTQFDGCLFELWACPKDVEELAILPQ